MIEGPEGGRSLAKRLRSQATAAEIVEVSAARGLQAVQDQLERVIGAHSTASGHLFHKHPAGRSMNIRPPRERACGASFHR